MLILDVLYLVEIMSSDDGQIRYSVDLPTALTVDPGRWFTSYTEGNKETKVKP